MSLDKIDPTFVDDLEASREAVEVVAEWLRRQGYGTVYVPPTRVRPDTASRMSYSDVGDIEVTHRVEVRRRFIDFTGTDDYPYPTLFVERCSKIDHADPRPWAHITLNRSMTVALVVMGWTHPEWIRTTRFLNGRNKEIYECPLKLVKVVRIGLAL